MDPKCVALLRPIAHCSVFVHYLSIFHHACDILITHVMMWCFIAFVHCILQHTLKYSCFYCATHIGQYVILDFICII